MVDIIEGEMAVRRLENATDAFEKTISTNEDVVNVPNVGQVPSMKKRIDDAIGADTFTQVFRDVKDWNQGEEVTSPYQRYWFPSQSGDEKHYMWFAPLASTSNPITLGASPINDDNWESWDVTKHDITKSQNDIGITTFKGDSFGTAIENMIAGRINGKSGVVKHKEGYVYYATTNTLGDERGGAKFIVTTGLVANGRTIYDLSGGLFAKLYHDGSANLRQAGAPDSDGANIGRAIPTLLSVGVRRIYIDNKSFTFGGVIDLDGAAIIANKSTYTVGDFINGTLEGVKREERSNFFIDGIQHYQPQVSKGNVKILTKVSATPEGGASPYGETYAVLSPSSFGGVSMFFLANGLGTTAPGNLGAPFDRLRPVNTYLALDGVSIMDTPKATTGTVESTTYDLLNIYYGVNLTSRWSNQGRTTLSAINMSAGATVTFEITGGVNESNVAFYTSTGSSEDATITVDGHIVKTFSAKGSNKVAVVNFQIPTKGDQKSTVTINAGGSRLYLWGIDFNLVSNMPSRVGSPSSRLVLSHNIVMHSYQPITYSGFGASIDTVCVDQDGAFGGSYHGGDLAEDGQVEIKVDGSQVRCNTSAYTETNASFTIQSGESLVGKSVRVRYVGKIQMNPIVNLRMTWDFGVDGGCDVRGWYTAIQDSPFLTIYTGMHSTSRDLLNTPWKTYPVNATGNTDELQDALSLYQFGNSSQQIAIYPQRTNSENSTILARLWDVSNYIKYYYTPVALPSSSGGAILKSGKTFEFGCLYQYGSAIV